MKLENIKNIKPALISAVLLSSVLNSSAASFNWNNTILTNNFASDGTQLDTQFTFRIGTLGTGFDLENPTTWVDNFIFADSDTYNETGFSEIGRTPVVAPQAIIGSQPYIFGFSDAATFGQVGSEGVLFTSANWELFPDPEDRVNPTYSVSETTEVLFGAVNGNPLALGTPGLSNLGDFSDGLVGERLLTPIPAGADLTLNDFEIQAFGFTSVPEPSSLALLLLGMGGLITRRRR